MFQHFGTLNAASVKASTVNVVREKAAEKITNRRKVSLRNYISQAAISTIAPNLRRRQYGFSMLEVLASASMLTIMIGMYSTLTIRVNRLNKDIEREQSTLQEVANVLENMVSNEAIKDPALTQSLQESSSDKETSVDTASPQADKEIPLPPLLKKLWPAGKLLLSEDNDILGKRLTVAFYRQSDQSDALPIQLHGWVKPLSRATQTTEFGQAGESVREDTDSQLKRPN